MRRAAVVSLAGAMALGILGCATKTPAPTPSLTAETAAPPPSSPLAKIHSGMGQREVQDLIGPPTDQKFYITGKAWIPWYFGPDAHRVAYYYRGMGRVVFSGGSAFGAVGKVIRVEYDPSESGYAR